MHYLLRLQQYPVNNTYNNFKKWQLQAKEERKVFYKSDDKIFIIVSSLMGVL